MSIALEESKVQINIKGRGYHSVEINTPAYDLVTELQSELPYQVVALSVNNDLKDLDYVFTKPCQVELLDLSTEIGFRVYRRGVVFTHKGLPGTVSGNSGLGQTFLIQWAVLRAGG